jgi:predicted DNA-binding transcriptional regulator AlpA
MQNETKSIGRYAAERQVPNAEPGRDWFDVRDLAGRYQCSTRHVLRMADRGAMPFGTKLGQLRRWSASSILEWEAGGCRPVRSVRGGGA